MTKTEIISLIENLGFFLQKTEESENGSIYHHFKNADDYNVWVGSTFLETELCPFALDYKRAEKDTIIKFIETGGIT